MSSWGSAFSPKNLKRLSLCSRFGIGTVFGKLDANTKLALPQVENWDRVKEVKEQILEETEAKKEAKDSFKKWVNLEEIHWRQKSRDT